MPPDWSRLLDLLPMLHARYTIAAIKDTPSTTPTAIPAFAPVDKPEFEGAPVAVGEDVALALVAVLIAALEVGVVVDGELVRLDVDVDVVRA